MADMTNRRQGPVLQHAETMDPNSQIVSKLRALYSAVEREPLPDAFLDLLQQLHSVENARKGR